MTSTPNVPVPTTRLIKRLVAGLCATASLLASAPTFAADGPGIDAISEFRGAKPEAKAIENRFFLKEGRFEISPVLGYVPNNPFARRYVGGAVLGYHFTESVSAQAQLSYSPDLGERDLKGLTSVLLDRAFNAGSSGANFQQPLDKVTLSAIFGAAWAPIYGKINIVGETVLNFDLYLFGGAGVLIETKYVAVYDSTNIQTGDIVNLQTLGQKTQIAPVVGIGQNYFITQGLSFKIDVRSAFWIDDKPQYNPSIPVTEKRLYNNLIVSAGVGLFFPKMKPRLYNF